jgi:TonB family protein
MMQESLTNSPLLAGIAITLIHFLWQGVLVALVLKLLLTCISYKKSQIRYALTATAMLANLVLPLITFFIVYDIEYRQATDFVQALPLLDQSFYLERMQASNWYIEWFEYLPSITIFWLGIVIILSVKLLVELYNVNKLPLQGTTAADAALINRFENLSTKIGLSKKVTLLLSHKIDVPMAIGWLKPVVLIPFSMLSGLTPQQLDMLLLHELAHIRRNDYLVNFLQTLVETLLFFHPMVRWVSKQMRNEREYCSDDIAVHHGGNALAYAHTLADTASLCHKHRQHAIPSMAMAASGGDLKQRVVRLLDNQPHCTQTTDSGKWLASFTILLIIVFSFSKYSLTLPVIDLQSGTISLNHSPVELNKSSVTYAPLAFEKVNTNASLANQLIAINSTTEDVSNSPIKTRAISDNDDLISKTVKKNKTNMPTTALTTKPETSLKNTNTKYYDELPIVLNSSSKQNLKQSQRKPKRLSNNVTASTKSMSELAFERTDSKSKTTTFANPYSQQVASLLESPKAANTQLDVNPQARAPKVESIQLVQSAYRKIDSRNVNNFDNNFNSKINNKIEIQRKSSIAKLINSIEPRYPTSAKRKGIELEIMVEFSIDKYGFVKDIQFESKSKVNYFRNAIRTAMEKWRFLPAKENGVAVKSSMSKIFSFSLLK